MLCTGIPAFVFLSLQLTFQFVCAQLFLTGTQAPYYGRYVGVLQNAAYAMDGVVFVTSQSQLQVTDFTYREPFLLPSQNVTFWIGPDKRSGIETENMFPRNNGVYLPTQQLNPVYLQLFTQPKYIVAKRPTEQEVASIFLGGAKRKTTQNSGAVVPVAEAEPEPEPQPEPERKAPKEQQDTVVEQPLFNNNDSSVPGNGTRVRATLHVGRNGTRFVQCRSRQNDIRTSQADFSLPNLPHAEPPPKPDDSLVTKVTTDFTSDEITECVDQHVDSKIIIPVIGHAFTRVLEDAKALDNDSNERDNSTEIGKEAINTTYKAVSLSTMFRQRLLLTVPEGRSVDEFYWLSVYDHTANRPLATLILPTYQENFSPKPVQFRGFRKALSKEVGSSSIEVLNTKTILIKNFYFEGDAPGAWFMAGKSLIPSLSGQILPMFDPTNGTYNCDFLPAFRKPTDVMLKLPPNMDITDVFWLSVFCVPYSISFSHVYFPYANMVVPPDISNAEIPLCQLEN